MKRDAKFVGRTASVVLPQLRFVVGLFAGPIVIGLFAGPVSERVRFAVARPIRFLVLVVMCHSKKDAAIVPPSQADPARLFLHVLPRKSAVARFRGHAGVAPIVLQAGPH